MSVASLLQMRIVPLFFGFFEAIFLHLKSTRFWRPKAHFRPQSLRFRGRIVSAKTLGTRLPLVSARGLPPEVVSARLNFSARGPKNLLLHGKNQACRALYYWPACQNLGVPYPKWMSCKCALRYSNYPAPGHPRGQLFVVFIKLHYKVRLKIWYTHDFIHMT